ncbi:MAG: hypothetical protein ACOYET_10010 [Bacillota bacterium]
MGAGKTTVAQILKKRYGYRETAIGQMIKTITHSLHRAVLYGEAERYIQQLSASLGEYNPDFCNEVQKIAEYLAEMGPPKNKGLLRYAYQQLGTEAVRKYYPDTWIRFTLRRAETLNRQGFPVVVSDVRFPDEFVAFVGAKYTPFEVFAPVKTRIKRMKKRDGHFDVKSLEHSSEKYSFGCPIIDNSGTIKELKKNIKEIFSDQTQKHHEGALIIVSYPPSNF